MKYGPLWASIAGKVPDVASPTALFTLRPIEAEFPAIHKSSPDEGRGIPAPCRRVPPRLLVTVTPLSAVALNLSVDCPSVTGQLLRNRAF